jgi:hypothetical protein
MKTVLFRGVAIFFVLIVATSLMMDVFKTNFGSVDFFQKHGFFFLFFITIFPRLTLLFSSVASGGFLWWLGFLFCPRILVASLATVAYFHTNPLLVILSWLIALGGEFFEKWGLGSKKNRFVFRVHRAGTFEQPPFHHPGEATQATLKKDDAIEAEFRKE